MKQPNLEERARRRLAPEVAVRGPHSRSEVTVSEHSLRSVAVWHGPSCHASRRERNGMAFPVFPVPSWRPHRRPRPRISHPYRHPHRRDVGRDLGRSLYEVALPPGRFILATRPTLTGSLPFANTIGMAVVAALAACAEPALPVATRTATGRRTRSNASASSWS